ncbi:MAG: FG-GAP-like repeat-containing protein [bacterium]
MGSSPQVVDWNSDGIPDIISGDRNGYFNVFIRDSLGGLAAHMQYRLLDSLVWDVGYNSQPAVFDWDNDGRKDVIIGNESYEVRLYLNQATDTWPLFQDYELVTAGGQAIRFYRGNPYVFDLDRDGLDDLIVGENNGWVHFFRNVGSIGAPGFAAGETLKLEDGSPLRYNLGNYYGSRCGFGDWNNDGVPDFLLGTYEGHVALYLGIEETGVEEERQAAVGRFEAGPVPGRSVRFSLTLSRPGRLGVLDAAGRVVRRFAVAGGEASLAWDGTDESGARLAAGAYFARLNVGGQTRTVRLMLTD